MATNAPIVVPLDGSHNAENALPFAALASRLYEAPVHFIHIADKEEVDTPTDLARARAAFDDYARDLAKRYGADAHGVQTEVLHGSPAGLILDYAADARLIVIASHGRGGFKAAIIGSVADKVVRGACVPVFFIPGVGLPSAAEIKNVLIALDGSEEAERGLHLGREIAAKVGAHVSLLRSYNIAPPVGVEFGYYPVDVVEALRKGAEEYLNNTARPGEEKYVVQASAAIGIEEAANRIDAGLVVLASRGKGLAGRLAFGSTTDRVMHSLHRPMLIVPPAEGE